MNSQPAASAGSLRQSPRTELSLRGTRISPGLASGTVWMAGDILDCSAETHRIEPHQVEAEMERIGWAFGQVNADWEDTAQRVGEQIDPSLAEIFRARPVRSPLRLSQRRDRCEARARALSMGCRIHWVARWCSGRRSWRKDILIGTGVRRNPTRITMAPA